MDVLLFVIVPYVCLATFVVGHFWRYRYDKFGWTTRSSQLYEDRLLRWGSPLFHFGMLGVVGGHVIGLLVPRSWTEAVGISDEGYHLDAVVGETPTLRVPWDGGRDRRECRRPRVPLLRERLSDLAVVAVDRDRLHSELPRLDEEL